MKKLALITVALLLFSVVLSAKDIGETWLLIDTNSLTLKVMRADQVEAVFKNISIGRNGAGATRRRGDEKTPLGDFKIGWINRSSRYHLFFGFIYPSLKVAEEGFANGVIDLDTFIEIRTAMQEGQIPPQDSGLGGQIGIHGLGNADPLVHQKMNWTEGCIALTNDQINSLERWVYKGMRVVII